MQQPNSIENEDLNLNTILNILWRRKAFIVSVTILAGLTGVLYGALVTPLYSAKATAQAGVTSFTNEGKPTREWRLKDIVQWYRRGEFNPGLAESMSKNPKTFRPAIRATHIPRSPQSMGGNTISLYTMASDPEIARRILENSVLQFNNFAGSDTTHSNLHLMRVKLRANISNKTSDISRLETERERRNLQIASTEADKNLVRSKKTVLEIKILEIRSGLTQVNKTRQAYAAMLKSLNVGIEDFNANLEMWEREAQELQKQRTKASNQNTDTLLLLTSESIGSLVAELGKLRLGLFDQSARKLRWEEAITSLKRKESELETQIQVEISNRDVQIPRELFGLEQKISELVLQRDKDLAYQGNKLQQELKTMKSQLASLTPLELIGDARATAGPVRPRKQRAIVILLILGFALSIFSAFSLEYFSKNWRQITKPKSPDANSNL